MKRRCREAAGRLETRVHAEAAKHKTLGDSAFDEKHWDAAIIHYSVAIEVDPQYAIPWVNRGLAYEKQGNYIAALNDLVEAHKLMIRPDGITRCVESIDRIFKLIHQDGMWYKKRGDKAVMKESWADGISWYSRAIKKDQTFPHPYFNRAVCREHLGEFNEALTDYTQARELFKREDLVDNCRRAIERIKLLQQGRPVAAPGKAMMEFTGPSELAHQRSESDEPEVTFLELTEEKFAKLSIDDEKGEKDQSLEGKDDLSPFQLPVGEEGKEGKERNAEESIWSETEVSPDIVAFLQRPLSPLSPTSAATGVQAPDSLRLLRPCRPPFTRTNTAPVISPMSSPKPMPFHHHSKSALQLSGDKRDVGILPSLLPAPKVADREGGEKAGSKAGSKAAEVVSPVSPTQLPVPTQDSPDQENSPTVPLKEVAPLSASKASGLRQSFLMRTASKLIDDNGGLGGILHKRPTIDPSTPLLAAMNPDSPCSLIRTEGEAST